MWYPEDMPILESVFQDIMPNAQDIADVFGFKLPYWYTTPLSYRELAEWAHEQRVLTTNRRIEA